MEKRQSNVKSRNRKTEERRKGSSRRRPLFFGKRRLDAWQQASYVLKRFKRDGDVACQLYTDKCHPADVAFTFFFFAELYY